MKTFQKFQLYMCCPRLESGDGSYDDPANYHPYIFLGSDKWYSGIPPKGIIDINNITCVADANPPRYIYSMPEFLAKFGAFHISDIDNISLEPFYKSLRLL